MVRLYWSSSMTQPARPLDAIAPHRVPPIEVVPLPRAGRWTRFFMVVAFALATVTVVLLRDAVVDDAFVYLQVARQIAHHGEWAFNPQHAMNPCTGPLYVVLVIGIMLMGIGGETALLVAFGSGLWVAMLLSERLVRHHALWARCMALILPLTIGALLQSAGLESVWFLVALLAVAQLAYSEREGALGCSLAAAALLRPEGLLLLPVVMGLRYVARQRLVWRSVALVLGVLALWGLFAWNSFGEVVPHTVRVKHLQGGMGWWAQQGGYLSYFVSLATFPLLTGGLALLGIARMWRRGVGRDRGVLVVLLFAILQVGAFSLLKAPFGYFWYNIPGYFALGLAGLFGLEWVKQRFLDAALFRPSALIVSTCLLTVTLFVASADPVWRVPRAFRLGAEYRSVGEWIAQHTPSRASVAVAEIGYVGYYAERQIIDMHGLLHPEALSHLNDREPDWWFQQYAPDVIVMHRPPWPNEPTPINWSAAALQRFHQNYELAFTVKSESGLSEALEVYQSVHVGRD